MKKTLLILFIFLINNIYCQQWDFKPSPINNALLQNTISGIQKDNKGFLWISTQFGIYKYDGKNVTPFTAGRNQLVNSNRFSYIIKPQKSDSLITLDEKGEYYIYNGQIIPITINRSKVCITNPDNLFYYDVKKIKQWIGKETRLGSTNTLLFENDTLVFFKEQLINLSKNEIIKSSPFYKLGQIINTENKNYQLQEQGIFELCFKDKEIQKKKIYALLGQKDFIKCDKEIIWFQYQKMIVKFNLVSKKIIYKIPLQGFNIIQATSIYEDVNRIYIGTSTQGIFESPVYKESVLKINQARGSENLLYTYLIDKPTKTYYSITTSGLYSISEDGTKVQNEYSDRLEQGYLLRYKNWLWFGNTNNEIIRYDLIKKQGKKIIKINESNLQLKRIEQLNDSVIYITSTKYILSFNLNNKQTDTVYKINSQNLITSSIQAKGKWFIGTEKGLEILDPTNNTEIHYLASEYIRSILIYDNEKIIIGTYSSGTYLLSNGQLIHLNDDTKLISKAVVSIAKDKDGDLWVLCNKGVFIWKKAVIKSISSNQQDNHYEWFLGTESDLPCTELNGGEIPNTFANEIVLPSTNGLVILNKELILRKKSLPNISVSNFFVDNTLFPMQGKPIEIKPNHHDIKIVLDFPYFESDNNFKVSYRIQGLFEEWKPLNLNRIIELNVLAKGHYFVEIKINQHAEAIKIIEFDILPFWYQTIWFYLLLSILLIAGFITTLKARTAILKNKQIDLQRIIDEKTKQLQFSIKTISASEKEVKKLYKKQNKLYSILMHDLTSPLLFLSNFSLDELKKQKTSQLIELDALKTISNTSSELFKFINEFLFWLKKQDKNLPLQLVETDLGKELQEVVQLYEKISLINNNKIVFFPKSIPLYFYSDADLLKIIFRNILDNANKYTQNGVIKISYSIDEQGKSISVVIQDSGVGLPDHILSLLNQELPKETLDPSINANHKMGIQISREFIQQLHGKLNVASSKENGTTFEIIFDINTKQPN